MSSPENCDIQHNRNPNKRFKKENSLTESVECLEANVRPNLGKLMSLCLKSHRIFLFLFFFYICSINNVYLNFIKE